MTSNYELPHINIENRCERVAFKSTNQVFSIDSGRRDPKEHAGLLRKQLFEAVRSFEQSRPKDARVTPTAGVYLELELQPTTNPDTYEKKNYGLKPALAKPDVSKKPNRIVGLFVPDNAKRAFDDILNNYQNFEPTEKKKNPPLKPFVESIEAIRTARLETFWTDAPDALPQDPNDVIWWQVWCVESAKKELENLAQALDARCAHVSQWLYFPEHVVVPVQASRTTMELMLFARFSITELRRATDTPSAYIDDLDLDEQIEWTNDLAERIKWPGSDAPAVCLLDTGVNRAHNLIEPALAPQDLYAVDQSWGVDDTGPQPGHGTQMGGISLHGDLVYPLESSATISLSHRLESVKILPPPRMPQTQERFYGAVTKSAINIAEIGDPNRKRVFCMAVTNEDKSEGQPSGWSAALDQEAAGFVLNGKRAPRRLILVSTGNAPNPIRACEIQRADDCPIFDPAQAWNVLTVGGYTDKIKIQEPNLNGYTPLVKAGDISPFTRTSMLWDTNKRNRPIKPDIVMEAGNRAIDRKKINVVDTNSLSVATSGPNIGSRPIVSFRGTSAATAEASRLACRIMAENSDYWPETIRALMIHGAEWTQNMRSKLNPQKKKDALGLLRHFGYGVPTFERAISSAKNHLALVAQSEIQPYGPKDKFYECHYYDLPWPQQAFEELGDAEIKLKITLSYFIDPNPGALASLDPYRYQSFGLRFNLKRRQENTDSFKKRVNAEERPNSKQKPSSQPDNDKWRFPDAHQTSGSLFCNEWTGPAVNLLARDMLCIKPVGGWWKNRANKDTRQQTTRYALVVSVKSASQDVDLYTPIKAIVDTKVPVPQEVDIGF